MHKRYKKIRLKTLQQISLGELADTVILQEDYETILENTKLTYH